MSIEQRFCVMCKHFDWEAIGYQYYSSLTGGTVEGGFLCYRGHFEDYLKRANSPLARPETRENLRELLEKAETCPDFVQGE